jgi:hypothetical protein
VTLVRENENFLKRLIVGEGRIVFARKQQRGAYPLTISSTLRLLQAFSFIGQLHLVAAPSAILLRKLRSRRPT